MSIARCGNLRAIFEAGESELLNGIARLAILYEDLRLEMNELRSAYDCVIQQQKEDVDGRVLYFLRRAIATLQEFGSCLNVIRMKKEFKLASAGMTSMDAQLIEGADKFIQQNWTRIKDLRNDLAGH